MNKAIDRLNKMLEAREKARRKAEEKAQREAEELERKKYHFPDLRQFKKVIDVGNPIEGETYPVYFNDSSTPKEAVAFTNLKTQGIFEKVEFLKSDLENLPSISVIRDCTFNEDIKISLCGTFDKCEFIGRGTYIGTFVNCTLDNSNIQSNGYYEKRNEIKTITPISMKDCKCVRLNLNAGTTANNSTFQDCCIFAPITIEDSFLENFDLDNTAEPAKIKACAFSNVKAGSAELALDNCAYLDISFSKAFLLPVISKGATLENQSFNDNKIFIAENKSAYLEYEKANLERKYATM